jgi:hypothetical protein
MGLIYGGLIFSNEDRLIKNIFEKSQQLNKAVPR